MSFDIQHILLPIVLLPIFGALHNGTVGRRSEKQVVTTVAVGSVALAFVLSMMGFVFLLMNADDPAHQRLTHDVYEWFSITVRGVDVPIRVRFVMDHLSGVMTCMVTGIGLLIHVYSVGYMEEDPGYWRFMTYLNLFMASMLVLVLASNMPLMFVGWEGVGLCSYLLIGFWYENEDYAKAGRKAFVVNRIGDFGVLIGMFLLVSAVARPDRPDAFEFASINAAATSLGLQDVSIGAGTIGITVATAAVLFLFLGCAGKSAQIPLYVWLPDAMAGPTPVSALIHAATMVTAGVYLLVRLSPLVVESTTAMSVIAIVGALTALLAASIALVQNQMKRILAYSTVSQLGFMFAAVGVGAFAGGFFHVFTHAFFKACLFLGAGSVMHAVHAHGDADIRYLGNLKKYLKKTHITFAISTAAIAGLPLLSGFFSKDEILLGALAWASAPTEMDGMAFGPAPWVGWFVFVTLVLAATMTAFYMFRLYFRTFHGEFKGGHPPDAHGHDDHAHDHGHHAPHESPGSMTIPLIALAAGAALAGFLGLPHLLHLPNWWAEWLTPQAHHFSEAVAAATAAGQTEVEAIRAGTSAARETHSAVATLQFGGQLWEAPAWAALTAMVLGTLAGLTGFGLAWVWYKQGNGEVPARLRQQMPGLHRFLMDKWRVDELYGVIFVQPMQWLGVLAANLDRYFVDNILARGSATLVSALGYLVTRTQTGVVFAYAGMFVVGLGGLAWWFTYPHAHLEAEASIGEVTWTAGSGYGYEYRWDFDSDGEWDTEWDSEAVQTHDYRGAAYYSLVAILETPRDVFGETEIEVEPGDDPVVLPDEALGEIGVRTEVEVDVRVGTEAGVRVERTGPPSLQYDEGGMTVIINGASIPDRDGGDDGRFRLMPGDSLSLGGGRLTVAVRVRGTVEVKNGFGNLSRSTEEITLRVPRHAEPQAALEAAPAGATR